MTIVNSFLLKWNQSCSAKIIHLWKTRVSTVQSHECGHSKLELPGEDPSGHQTRAGEVVQLSSDQLSPGSKPKSSACKKYRMIDFKCHSQSWPMFSSNWWELDYKFINFGENEEEKQDFKRDQHGGIWSSFSVRMVLVRRFSRRVKPEKNLAWSRTHEKKPSRIQTWIKWHGKKNKRYSSNKKNHDESERNGTQKCKIAHAQWAHKNSTILRTFAQKDHPTRKSFNSSSKNDK